MPSGSNEFSVVQTLSYTFSPCLPKSAAATAPSADSATACTLDRDRVVHPPASVHRRSRRAPKSVTTVVPSVERTLASALAPDRTTHPPAAVQRRSPRRPKSATRAVASAEAATPCGSARDRTPHPPDSRQRRRPRAPKSATTDTGVVAPLPTVIDPLVPVTAGLSVSVPVIVCGPAVSRVAVNVPVPLVRAESAGRTACTSELV